MRKRSVEYVKMGRQVIWKHVWEECVGEREEESWTKVVESVLDKEGIREE